MKNKSRTFFVFMTVFVCILSFCMGLKEFEIQVEAAKTATNASTVPQNETMIQYFEWYLSEEGAHWNRLAADAANLAQFGINSVWIPPAYKGAFGTIDVGYGAHDLYDLGEFNQKGTVRTKYGTKAQLQHAIQRLKANDVKVYADVVMNHKAGGDTLEKVTVTEVNPNNRLQETTAPYSMNAYSKFTFPGRNGQYSTFNWDARHFNGVDWDPTRQINRIFKFQGKTWDTEVENTFGNYDYLMFNDIDYDNPEVVNEMHTWGTWFVNELNLDGFRLDAVKHVKFDFMRDWLDNVRKSTEKPLFAVGEYWSSSTPAILNYLNKVNSNMSLFDVDLHYRMHRASTMNGSYDLRTFLNGVLSSIRPDKAVTFVDNHDTQPGQSLQSWVEAWFKPQAYALILTRQEGIPMLFYGDYYGIANNQLVGMKAKLDPLLLARKSYAYGVQHSYFDHPDVVGWTREGIAGRPDSGLATVISDGASGSKWMFVGSQHAGEVWTDLTGNRFDRITISTNGWALFPVNGRSVSVYVKDSEKPNDEIAPSVPQQLLVTKKSEQETTLHWFASSDQVGVTAYEVFRDGVYIATTESTFFTDRGLAPSNVYRYQVRALDRANNRSTFSDSLTLKTNDPAQGNQVTIYYKKGFTKPFMHYRPLGGTWTASPGVALQQAEHPDFMKVTVQIGTATSIEACFSNGAGIWDSNSGKNYVFQTGIFTLTPNASATGSSITIGIPSVIPPDRTPPTPPESIHLIEQTETAITLGWNDGQDLFGIAGYRLLRDGNPITTMNLTSNASIHSSGGYKFSFTDGGLTPNTEYTYTVHAFDAAGNVSLPSPALKVVTKKPSDTPNTIRIYYKKGFSHPHIHYRPIGGVWSSSPGVALRSSEFHEYTTAVLNIGQANRIEAVFNDGGIQANSITWDNNNDANYIIEAGTWTFIPSGFKGGSGKLLSGVPEQSIPDTTAPTVPNGFKMEKKSENSISFSWSPSTDNVGVIGYQVFRNGIKAATTRTTIFHDYGLVGATTYIYTIRAFDESGNNSATSSLFSVSTDQPPDRTPPTKPNGLTFTAKTTTSISLSWSSSTDNLAVTGYEIWRDGARIGTVATIAFVDVGLVPGKVYTYVVRAFDANANISDSSEPYAIRTEEPPPPPSNFVTIYYKKGFSTAFAHFRPQGGVWTTAPGIPLIQSEVNDFLKTTINIGTATSLEVCFNNGANVWDSNRTLNYVFNVGTWTYTPTLLNGSFTGTGVITSGVPVVPPPDQVAPRMSSNLQLTNKTDRIISLSWVAASDNVGVKGYEIFRNGARIASITSTTFTDNELRSSTMYSYTVRAFDEAGNFSANSQPLIVTTNPALPPPVNNTVTIYYKRGYSTPFIHYRAVTIASGSSLTRLTQGPWTNAPGIAMSNSEIAGFSKITISIGTATHIEACFNNGRGTWDSNNGRNYLFKIGTSTYTPATDGRSAGTIR